MITEDGQVMEVVPTGTEVKTRSGVFPSIPYVKQENGTWKPKYNYNGDDELD